MPRRIGPRRIKFSRVSDADARVLLEQYGGLICVIAGDWAKRARGCSFDDLLSVGRIAVLEGHTTCPAGDAPEAWIKRVIRWRIKEEATRFIELPLPFAGEDLEAGADPEDLYATAFAREAIGRLGPRLGVVLQARLEGYTCAEVGQQLGVSPQRVNELEHEAYALLRAWIADEGEVD